jgi:hypothetical protein
VLCPKYRQDARESLTNDLLSKLEELCCGDWLYNLLSAQEPKHEMLCAITDAMTNTINKFPVTEAVKNIAPTCTSIAVLFKGMSGMLQPTPGPLNGVCVSDVAFLQPFQRTDECISKSPLRCGGALARVFKNSGYWKRLRLEYQKVMGADDQKGRQLKDIVERASKLCTILEKDVSEDDVEGETAQCEAMEKANELFAEFSARRPADVASLMNGALQSVDRQIGVLCRLQWRHISESEEQDMKYVQVLRDVCKACGVSELYQGTHSAMAHLCTSNQNTYQTL